MFHGKIMKSIHCILFDLDGTISESAPGIIKSVIYGLSAVGIHEKSPERLRSFIGPPLNVQMKKLYHLDDEEIKKAIHAFRSLYETKGLWECRPYKGIPELIRLLYGQGAILAVASSKPEPFAKEIITHFGLAPYFSCICGSRMGDELDQGDQSRSRKGIIIHDALTRLFPRSPACPLSRILMVGDTAYDMEGARENHLPSIGVTYGYGEEKDLRKAGAEEIAHSVPELRELLLSFTES